MNALKIHEKIKMLSLAISQGQEESISRESSQALMLLIRDNGFLSFTEKQALNNELRKAVRPLARLDYETATRSCEINSLLGELCLAASFYLLADGKRLCLFESENDAFAEINKRSFENCFFSIVSALFKANDILSVEVKPAGKYLSVLIFAKNFDESINEKTPAGSLVIHERGETALALKMKAAEKATETQDEDFSLLLADSFSPLQIWLCDI